MSDLDIFDGLFERNILSRTGLFQQNNLLPDNSCSGNSGTKVMLMYAEQKYGKGNIKKIKPNLLWPFSQTFGLAYLPLNSAKLSCSSEVTLTLSENMGKGNISICGYVPLISCQKSLTALPFIRQVRLFPTRYPTSLTNDLCSCRHGHLYAGQLIRHFRF